MNGRHLIEGTTVSRRVAVFTVRREENGGMPGLECRKRWSYFFFSPLFFFSFFLFFFFFFFFFSLIYPVTKHPCKRGGSRGTLIRENHCAASFGRVNCVKIYMRMGRETEVRIVGRKNGKIGIKCFIVYYLCTYGGYCLVWLFVKVCEANLWMERKKKKKKKEKRRKRYACVHIIWKFLFVAVKL